MRWHCRLLGGLSVEGAERRIERFRTEKTALLLGYLAHYLGEWQERAALADMLWGEGRDPDASLRTALSALRRQLEPVGVATGSVLQTAGNRIRLNPDAVQTDVAQFRALLRHARTVSDANARRQALVDALHLYRGELLHGYEADWLLAPRTDLEQEYLRALGEAVPELLRVGEAETARQLAERATHLYPLSEIAARLLIRLHLSLNQQAQAEAAYQRLQSDLARLLGDYPRFTLESLRDEQFTVGVVERTSEPVSLMPTPVRPRTAVPAPLTRFFGREAELRSAIERLQQGTRLLTITGAPGVGKTRLGQELGLRLESVYGGRVFWVSLREARTEPEVRRLFAQAFECDADANDATLLNALAVRIGDAPALLITDNWEQVLDAAPLLMELLQRLPRLQAVALSRHPLELEGECWMPLEPLPAPDPEASLEELQSNPSVALFLDRAQQVRPDFALTPANAPKVAQLCHILEGAPLAIELAAAQLGTHSLSRLLQTVHDRLDWLASRRRDVGYPHRSLQAALESSYALLSAELQRALTQLAILQGEWHTPLADAILGEAATPTLDALVRHSLLQRRWENDTPYYSMLESVRLFALRKLNERGQALAERLLAYFETLGRTVRAEFNTAAQFEWLFTLRRLYPNLQTAMEWGVLSAPRRAATVLIDYGYFLDWERRWDEGRRWCVQLLGAEGLPRRRRAQLLSWLGLFLLRTEQYEQAETRLHESIQLCRRARDWDELAGAYNMLGLVCLEQARYEEAAQAFAHGTAAARRAARPVILAPVLHNWGILCYRQKQYREAQQLACEARALYEQIRAPLPLANTLNLLGVCYAELGQYAEAQACYEQAVAHYQTAGYRHGIAAVYSNLVEMALQQGQLDRAAHYLELAQRVCQEGGCSMQLQDELRQLQARLTDASADCTP
ncbi:MAG: tetratricopeptide repeat protein [Fimbriimonadales bacterium]|nr:tetratricopeptide repeat protein [Fimbriimonadales bacterium]